MHLVKHSVNTFPRKEFLKITVFSLLFFFCTLQNCGDKGLGGNVCGFAQLREPSCDWSRAACLQKEAPLFRMWTVSQMSLHSALCCPLKIIRSKLVICVEIESCSMCKAEFHIYVDFRLSTLFEFLSHIRAPFSLLFPAVRFSFKRTVTH